MVVARASVMDLASILKRNTFLTLEVRPAGVRGPRGTGGHGGPGNRGSSRDFFRAANPGLCTRGPPVIRTNYFYFL